MEGLFSIQNLRDGISLHCTDIVHLQAMTTRFLMNESCVKILLKLEGNARVCFGSVPLPLDAGLSECACPKGAVVRLNAPEIFERKCEAGTRQRMVVVTLSPEWFKAADMHALFPGEHLSIRDWSPTPRAVAIAEQLLHPATFDGPLHKLYLESRVLELVAEAFSRTSHIDQAAPPGLRPCEYRRIAALRELLDSGRADNMSMARIAQEMGCNANSLQQQFRRALDQTIFNYLRVSRLQRAATALQHEGVSVARAAEIAGYGNQANFSTAFRRYFGLSPKAYRASL